ncbi:hypothetical protein GCM10012275_21450 [Longimycelium tulufanense]|uniref:Peptidase M48 domain-containing protein n=1 Tax=Longimycelium tulufanense TaxID=907463 RepID=A0A8J3CAE1_9PSEU|nr:M56 family metallopeptidase [Longimycelium tulufanense]GGM50297.1 hypothetical protein GCM10012275_21450 [Longimycelium tulufanense]
MTWLALGGTGGAVALGVVAPVVLLRLRALRAAPRLGLATWLGTALAVVTVLLAVGPLALLADQVPGDPHSLRERFLHCEHVLGSAPLSAGIPVAISAIVGARLVVVGWSTIRRTRSSARRHRMASELVCTPDETTGALVLEHPSPIGYCLPGRPRRVVLSSGALRALDDEELAAVLTHEHAHLDGRHHQLVLLATVLATAVPVLPLLRAGRIQVGLLVERAADESAGRRHGRRVVASALLRMAESRIPEPIPSPAPSLGATESNLRERMVFLLRPSSRPATAASVLVASVTGLVIAPLVVGSGLVGTILVACHVLVRA